MTTRVRSIFLSDIHLGTPACQADRLLDFLKTYDSDWLFLAGDILDFWAMRRRGVYWSAAQNTVLQKILKRARHHVNVIFVPFSGLVGNDPVSLISVTSAFTLPLTRNSEPPPTW